MPAVPVRTGHTGQWVYDGEEFTADTVVMGNITVMAQYTPIEYYVAFEIGGTGKLEEGETAPNAHWYNYGSTISLPALPKKSGEVVGLGWKNDTGEFFEEGSTITVEGTMTFYAVYEGEVCNIYFMDLDGQVIYVQNSYRGENVTVPAAPPAPEGTYGDKYYGDFKGWASDSSSGEYIGKDVTSVLLHNAGYVADYVKLVPVEFVASGANVSTTVQFEVGHALPTVDDLPQAFIEALWADDDANGRSHAAITGMQYFYLPIDSNTDRLDEELWRILVYDQTHIIMSVEYSYD